MRSKHILIAVVLVTLFSVVTAFAGDTDSSAAPNATSSYTLENIYQRLNAGAAGAQSTWTEPAAGPGSTMHTLNEIMGKAPTVNDTNGAVPSEVLTGKTYWGLTSGEWGLRTGSGTGGGTTTAIPKTGQTTSYGTRDDGDLQKGVAWPDPRFTDNSDGTVTDNLTGLIWLKNANCFGQQTWANALTSANNLDSGSCGLSDGSIAGNWRLPNVRELYSLIDFSHYNPALPSGHPFTGVQSSFYWSSTTFASFTDNAWIVNLNNGSVYNGNKTYTNYVWPVRGGQ